jgi:hypothetical protein
MIWSQRVSMASVNAFAPVLGDETQVDVQVVDDVPAGADVGFGLQRGDTPL